MNKMLQYSSVILLAFVLFGASMAVVVLVTLLYLNRLGGRRADHNI